MVALPSRTTVQRSFPIELAVLTPPYNIAKRLDAFGARSPTLPLGVIVHGTGRTALGVLGALTVVVRSCPWVVPCLTLPSGEELLEPLLDLVFEMRHRIAVTRHRISGRSSVLAYVLAAVRQRTLPPSDVLAEYVSRRLHVPELGPALAEQFDQALAGGSNSAVRSVSTYSRLFARYGQYTARDWRAIARLAWHLGLRARRWSGEPEASPATLQNRAARRYARKFLSMPYSQAAQWLGWEWILERALRTGGYVH
jgi:hypothetical protein